MSAGEPLARLTSGFEREYVLFQLNKATTNFRQENLNLASEVQNFMKTLTSDFNHWTILDELGEETKNKYEIKFLDLFSNSKESEFKIKEWTSLLKELEVEKMLSLTPKAKIKS